MSGLLREGVKRAPPSEWPTEPPTSEEEQWDWLLTSKSSDRSSQRWFRHLLEVASPCSVSSSSYRYQSQLYMLSWQYLCSINRSPMNGSICLLVILFLSDHLKLPFYMFSFNYLTPWYLFEILASAGGGWGWAECGQCWLLGSRHLPHLLPPQQTRYAMCVKQLYWTAESFWCLGYLLKIWHLSSLLPQQTRPCVSTMCVKQLPWMAKCVWCLRNLCNVGFWGILLSLLWVYHPRVGSS